VRAKLASRLLGGSVSSKTFGNLLKSKYDFTWEVLDVIISGRSSIDSPNGFQTSGRDEATRFLESYGYNPQDPIEASEILGNFQEALNFIRKQFLQPDNAQGLPIEVPRKILEVSDVRDLLLMASHQLPGQSNDTGGVNLRNWACSLLKVMHTIAHIDKDLRSPHFADIQKQIFDRFYKVVFRDDEGHLFLGEGTADIMKIELVAFETKPKKARDSIILKLLHKPENVAEDIFDRVGIRFITKSRLDAIRVIKYLKDKMIIMPPNIKPSRSRNTLVDLDFFRNGMQDVLLKASKTDDGFSSEAELVSALEEAAQPPRVNPDNPHSSEFYRSIQFTGRQLIKLTNPLYNELKELKSLMKKATKEESDLVQKTEKIVEKIDLRNIQREVRFFYPFEVQVVDEKSNDENEKGRSAHSEYKRAQGQTALKRVMGSLADATR
jgi:uncharacterized protein (TIGR04562 family)